MEVKGTVVGKHMDSGFSKKNGNPWKKVSLVVQYEDGQFAKSVLLSNMQKPDDFNRIAIGDTGTFKFDGEVRESGGKYYLDLKCWSWKIDDDIPV
jgi:hypothetical protein